MLWSMASMAVCPICGRSAAPRAQNEAFPFCSTRCKQVDLGNWLEEQYRIAGPEGPPRTDPDLSGSTEDA